MEDGQASRRRQRRNIERVQPVTEDKMLTENCEFDEIYEAYKNLVLKAAYTYSGNYDIAEDIAQNTFLQL